MKNNLLRQLIMLSKFTLYGLFLQCVLFGVLIASDLDAQKIQSVNDVYVKLGIENGTVSEIFSKIEGATHFKFSYYKSEINLNQRVPLKSRKLNLRDILLEISKATGFTFRQVNNVINVRTNIHKEPDNSYDAVEIIIDPVTITGKVTSSEDNEGLPGVNVIIKGTSQGTVTDVNGNYKIDVPDESSILVFSSVGYQSVETTIGSKQIIDIALVPDIQALQEIVVVGYGTVKKSDLTGSVSSVGEDEIIQGPATSASRALQGKSAGVRVTQKTGRPGDDVIIRVRGGNSMSGGNDPLYVIDGFPVDGLGADFNPEDIASIEILKDASATAIYGSRGANGVVLITTKRGKVGKGQIYYHGYYGVQSLRKKIDMLDKNDFVSMQNEIALKDGEAPLTPDEIANLPNNDWQDLAYRNAIMQSHQLSASGGSENAKYYTALNYMKQEGILEGSDYNRVSIRMNGDIKASEKLTVKANINFTRTVDQNGNFAADGWGAIPFQALVMPPTTPIFDDNGKYTVFKGTPWGGTNPVGYSKMDKNTTTLNRVTTNVDANYQIIPDLTFQVTAGVDFLNSTNDRYSKIGIANGGPGTGQASKSMSKSYSLINENILTYNKQIGSKNRITAMAGFSYQQSSYDAIGGSASGFVSDVFENNLLQAGSNPSPTTSSYSDSKLISYLGRLNYSLLDRYLLTLTGRYDGSSKFGKENKFAFFPSAAVAWRMSEESFAKDISWLSNLKLRVSVGQAGNQAISPYQTLDRLSTNVPVFGSGENVGFVASGFSNEGLKWETTTQTDVGVDLGIFEDRINFVADYYIKNTTDLLYNASLPPSSGYSSSLRNVGEIENKGFEFEVSYRNLQGEIKWNTSLNMSFNRTIVKDLGTDNNGNEIKRIDSPIGGGNWFPLFLGEAPFQLYGYVLDGIYETDAAANEMEPGKFAGDYRVKDINGDGVITGDDQTLLTHLEPKFIFGFNNQISYKNFELSFLIVGSYGNDIVNEFNKYYTALGGEWNVTQEAWDNRWTGPGSGGTYAAASSHAQDYITFGPPSSLWVEDGSYLRVKDIKLSYTMPSSILKSFLTSATVYISGTNLITWTNYPHYDPEASWTSSSVNGWDRGVYPSAKSIIGGIQVTF